MTVSFESGIDLGGFTRAFFVVENRSALENVHFKLDVQMAPGVTVAPLDALLEEGSRAYYRIRFANRFRYKWQCDRTCTQWSARFRCDFCTYQPRVHVGRGLTSGGDSDL